MNRAAILKEIELLEAQADNMKTRCYKLRESLGLVSTRPNTRKGSRSALTAAVLANIEKNMLKKR